MVKLINNTRTCKIDVKKSAVGVRHALWKGVRVGVHLHRLT